MFTVRRMQMIRRNKRVTLCQNIDGVVVEVRVHICNYSLEISQSAHMHLSKRTKIIQKYRVSSSGSNLLSNNSNFEVCLMLA